MELTSCTNYAVRPLQPVAPKLPELVRSDDLAVADIMTTGGHSAGRIAPLETPQFERAAQ
jgi:hypothetical protein